jgi:hypothetical protein
MERVSLAASPPELIRIVVLFFIIGFVFLNTMILGLNESRSAGSAPP